jgi:hypothetical protein
MSEVKRELNEIIDHLEKEEDISLNNYQHKDPEGLGDLSLE